MKRRYVTALLLSRSIALTRPRPDLAKRLHVLQQAQEMLDRDANKIFKALEDAVGGTSTKAKEVRKAQMAADKATSTFA